LKGDHPRIISAKFGWDWLSSFRGEDFFFKFHTPFYLICIIGQDRQKFKVHKKIPYYMLKSSSLCLYSSNVGNFCLKIKQFWPFEKILFLVMAAILDTGRRWRT
jgi:hypothetical protein